MTREEEPTTWKTHLREDIRNGLPKSLIFFREAIDLEVTPKSS